MAQTTYNVRPDKAFAGLVGDLREFYAVNKINGDTGAIPFGIFAARSGENKLALPAAATDPLLGVVMNTFWADNQRLTNADGIAAGGMCSVMKDGTVWVKSETAMVAGDPVYCRFSTGSSGSQKGSIRNDSNAGTCRRVKGALVETACDAAGVCMINLHAIDIGETELNESDIDLAQASISADLTSFMFVVPAGKFFVLDEAQYTNPTGLTSDTTNVFNIKVMNGSDIAANWNTTTGQEATIAADTVAVLTNGTLAKRTFAPGTTVKAFFDMGGSQTLPAGRLHLIGHWL